MKTIQRNFAAFLFLALIIMTFSVSPALHAAVAMDIPFGTPTSQMVAFTGVEVETPGTMTPDGFTWAG
jgi:hypothetical protein